MKTLRELTRGIAKIVDVLLGRVNSLEANVLSQEQRLADMEQRGTTNFHSMEEKQLAMLEKDEARQDNLSENDFRKELKTKYGSTRWAIGLINSIILGRKRRNEIEQ